MNGNTRGGHAKASGDKLKGHLAAAACYTIFGLNIVMNKDVANSSAVSPYALFMLRALGATILFWGVSLFTPGEKVAKKDMLKIVVASFVGLFVPQMTFLLAITMTTSIDTSILGSFTPIMTMFVAAVALKEPVTLKKAGGVALSFAGVLLLILNSAHGAGGAETTSPRGIVLMMLNGLSFAVYLGTFRPLISRYSVVTFMKWMFLYSTLICAPFCLTDTLSADYGRLAGAPAWEVAYIVFFATFVAYFLIPVGQKHLRPTIVSLYSYLQPVIAVVISICSGMDRLTWEKAASTACVFAGVWIVSTSKARKG